MTQTLSDLQQHQLVILRRLRGGPLTEFELTHEITAHSGYTEEQCGENIGHWLDALRLEGLVWAGELSNAHGTTILAAALTNKGRELVN